MNIFELLDKLIEAVESYAFACDHGWPENAQSEMIKYKTAVIELVAKLEAENKILAIRLEEKCENDSSYGGNKFS